jgi:head-tail adaptor
VAINANARVSYKPIGDRRHVLTFQSASIALDGFGRQVETWSTYAANVWGAITEVPVVVSELDATVLRILETEYRSDVKVQHRVIVDGDTDNPLKVIAIVNPEAKRRALQIHCAEVNRTPIGFS